MNIPLNQGRSAIRLCAITALIIFLAGGIVRAQYTIPDPCSHYTIDFQGGISLSQTSIPVDVELKHVPDMGTYPSVDRHYDVSPSSTASQQYGFAGNNYYMGTIKVFGTTIPKDGQPHKVATGTPGQCIEVTITNDAAGCPVITMKAVSCCDGATIIWDKGTIEGISLEYADHSNSLLTLTSDPDPNATSTTQVLPGDVNNPAIGIIVHGKHLGIGSVYREYGSGGNPICLKYQVTQDPNTGCITVQVTTIPCPPRCSEYKVIISNNCQDASFFPIGIKAGIGGAFPHNDSWTYYANGVYTHSISTSGTIVEWVELYMPNGQFGGHIPIDNQPYIISVPGTNDHRRIKVTATFDWETGCTVIYIDCLYSLG